MTTFFPDFLTQKAKNSRNSFLLGHIALRWPWGKLHPHHGTFQLHSWSNHHSDRQEEGGKGSRDEPAVSKRKGTHGDQGSVAWQASRQRALPL